MNTYPDNDIFKRCVGRHGVNHGTIVIGNLYACKHLEAIWVPDMIGTYYVKSDQALCELEVIDDDCTILILFFIYDHFNFFSRLCKQESKRDFGRNTSRFC